jgi:DNA polymerase IV
MPPPTILHLDADAFFVSCEQARDPSLRGKVCAVGGTTRGIISSASYEARALGVYTPMPTSRARRICPGLLVIPHTAGLYGRVSRQMFDLCESVTPLVQRNSIDEGYLDLTPCGFSRTDQVSAAARALQEKIFSCLGISVSLGIASNKLVAQVASKLRKPRGFVVVERGDEAAFLAPLPIGRLPGVGPKSEATFKARGILTPADFLSRPDAEQRSLAGSDWRAFADRCRGIDTQKVETEEDDAKSYSQQETFGEDVADPAEIERVLKGMVDSLLPKIRADGKRAKTLTVKIRYPDFTQESHGRSLPEASELEAPFYPLLAPLLTAAWRKRRPLRLVSVRFSGIEDGGRQLDLFRTADDKRRRLAAVVDRLNAAGSPSAWVTHGHQLRARTGDAP